MQNVYFVLPSSRALPLSPDLGVCSIEWLGCNLVEPPGKIVP